MGIERHRWESRKAEMSGDERVNTRLSGSARIDSTNVLPSGELRGLTKLMKITEDVRKYAAEQAVGEIEALQHGLEEKARQFTEAGADIYAKA